MMTMPLSHENELMRHLVIGIVRALVDQSDLVTVEVYEENGCATLKLRTAQADIGKVIGKQGRTARSIRTIVAAAGLKWKKHYSVDIQEEEHRSQ